MYRVENHACVGFHIHIKNADKIITHTNAICLFYPHQLCTCYVITFNYLM